MRNAIFPLIPALLLVLVAASCAAWDTFLVLTTDYTTYGGATAVDRADPWSADIDVATVNSDAVGRWHDGLYYVVNRGAANIQILDPAQGFATVDQFSVGLGRNPQDIAFAPDGSAYVTCYDEAVFLRIDPADGTILDSWSTAAFADADGLPETAQMLAVGGSLYVACQRLDRNGWWAPAGGSRLLVFDMFARDWVDLDPGTPEIDGIPLAGQNPYTQLAKVPDEPALLVGTVGNWTVADAGLERIDLATRQPAGLAVSESELGGEVLDVAVLVGNRGWCIVSDGAFVTHLKTFTTAGGDVETVASAGGYDFETLAWDGADLIYLCDRTLGAAGLRVFDAWTAEELTSAPVALGRPPYMCVLPRESGATAVEAATPVPARLRAPWPNPANPRVNLAFAAAPGARVRLDVCDVRGRRLRTVHPRADAAGEGLFVFDGLDDAGRPLCSGSYRAVIDGRVSRSFALVR